MSKTNPSFLNGVPELLVLQLLDRQPMHGYDLVQAIREATAMKLDFGEGCIYPVLHRLEEQKLLLNDPAYIRTVQRMAEVDGQKQAVVRTQRVKPWWKTDPSGQLVMSIKFGAKPIEFEKGKAGIVVPSKDKLPAVIDTLIAAVRAGELDELFSQAAKTGSIGKARKAA